VSEYNSLWAWGGKYYAEWILVSACFEIRMIYCNELNHIVDSIRATESYNNWNQFGCQQNVTCHAISQADSHWLLTAAARVRSHVGSCGICVGQGGIRTGCVVVL
jgi:hypothetical protein